MNNLTDKGFFKSNILDKSVQLSALKRAEPFADKNTRFETSFVANNSNHNGFREVLSRQSTMNSQVSHIFKAPNFDSLPVKKTSVKSIRSPQRRVQTGRIKNDVKSSQQSKMSLIPRPSFINSRKSLHGSRSIQLNARKELIKKMVFLAECALKENKEIKESPPVKMLAGLTPKKTPRSGGYFLLPEFHKKIQKLEDIKSPIEDFIKKEMYGYSTKSTPTSEKKNDVKKVKPTAGDIKMLSIKPVEEIKIKVNDPPERDERFKTLLHHCKTYSAEVNLIHEKLLALDDSFENKLQIVPDYRVYNEFCSYQSKKEEIYREIQAVEEDLKNFVATQTNIGQKIKAYLKKKREFFEKQASLHQDFERAVYAALAKWEDKTETPEEETRGKVETPKLRRSLRLSKIRKSKFDEKTPMTKKLRKLDCKSKGILKNGKV